MLDKYEKFLTGFDSELNKYFKEQKSFIFCKKGCSLCCSVGQFPMSRIEFDYLLEALRKLPDESKKIVSNRIKKLKKDKKNSTSDYEHACPFLIGNSCSVYSNRPLICRTFGLIKSAKTADGVSAALLPDCIHHQLNYSNVYDFLNKSFDEEKISQISFCSRPEAYDISLGSLYEKYSNSKKGIEFGDAKRMVEFLLEANCRIS